MDILDSVVTHHISDGSPKKAWLHFSMTDDGITCAPTWRIIPASQYSWYPPIKNPMEFGHRLERVPQLQV